MDFMNYINMIIQWCQSIIDWVHSASQYIFPEYPLVGTIAFVLTLCMFLFYFIRTDLKHALKISSSVFVVMVFILFMLHSFDRMFFA
jgi:hypothetical protein